MEALQYSLRKESKAKGMFHINIDYLQIIFKMVKYKVQLYICSNQLCILYWDN